MRWIELCLPNIVEVILHYIILVWFVKRWLNPKIKHMNKKEDIRDEVIREYWEKLQHFNTTCINANVNTRSNPQTLMNHRQLLEDAVLDIIRYKDSNTYDLDVFSESLNELTNKWDYFSNLLQKNSQNLGNANTQTQLGIALQNVKDANLKLIKEVRDVY